MKKHLIPGFGKYPDIEVHNAVPYVAFQQEDHIIVHRLNDEMKPVDIGQGFFCGQPTSYPKLRSYNGSLYLGYRDQDNDMVVQSIAAGSMWGANLGTGHGEQPLVFSVNTVFWQGTGRDSDPPWQVYGRVLETSGNFGPVRSGIGTGLSRWTNDGVVTMDEDRSLVPGYTKPQFVGNFTVAENPWGGTFCRYWAGGPPRYYLLFPGQDANTPRCTQSGTRLYVTAWAGGTGVHVGWVDIGEFSLAIPQPPEQPPQEDVLNKPGIDVLSYSKTIQNGVDVVVAHCRDRNRPEIEFKVKIVGGSVKADLTYDSWGPKSDYTGSSRPVTIKS